MFTPSVCFSVLTISGPAESITAIRKAGFNRNGNNPFSLEILLPTPHELLSKQGQVYPKNTSSDNWYDWRLRNWGTKRDIVYSRTLSETSTSWEFRFGSIWAPPLYAMQQIAATYSGLFFELHFADDELINEGETIPVEQRLEFCGTALYTNGECTKLHDGSTYWGVEPPEDSDISEKGCSYFNKNLDMERKKAQFAVQILGDDFVVTTGLPDNDEVDCYDINGISWLSF